MNVEQLTKDFKGTLISYERGISFSEYLDNRSKCFTADVTHLGDSFENIVNKCDSKYYYKDLICRSSIKIDYEFIKTLNTTYKDVKGEYLNLNWNSMFKFHSERFKFLTYENLNELVRYKPLPEDYDIVGYMMSREGKLVTLSVPPGKRIKTLNGSCRCYKAKVLAISGGLESVTSLTIPYYEIVLGSWVSDPRGGCGMDLFLDHQEGVKFYLTEHEAIETF